MSEERQRSPLALAIEGHKQALERYKPDFKDVLPPHITPDKLVRSVINALSSNQYLATQCDKTSILQAAMTAAVLGLEVDNAIGQGYIVPFKGRAQFIPGYKGYITLAYNSGFLVSGDAVRQHDKFSYAQGLNPTLEHVPLIGSPQERGPITHVYATARSNSLPSVFTVMHVDDVNAIRNKSQGYKAWVSDNKKDTPWVSHYEAMAVKTAIRALASNLPLNVQRAAALESAYERGHPAHLQKTGDFVDCEVINEQAPAPACSSEQPNLVLDLGLEKCERCGGHGTVAFKDQNGEGIEPCPACQTKPKE